MRSLVHGGIALVCLVACTRPPPPSAGTDGYGVPPAPEGPAPGRAVGPAPTAGTSGPTVPAVAPSPAPTRPPSPYGTSYQPRAAAHQRGRASYYADSLAGNPTASGERYDPLQLTAAHRTLPFGSIVDVVRRDGRWVRVRITDRGPFAKGRVIDLSRRAAEAIGMIEAGVVEVTLFVVRRGG